jgi:hypothetical protein
VVTACQREYAVGVDSTGAPNSFAGFGGTTILPTPDASTGVGSAHCSVAPSGRPITAPDTLLDRLVALLWDGGFDTAGEARSRFGGYLVNGTSADVECLARQMLDDQHAVAGMGRFVSSWLGLDQPYPTKDPVLYSGYGPDRLALLGRDTRDFAVAALLGGPGGFERLFTSVRAVEPAPSWSGASRPSALAAGLLADPGFLARTGTAWATPWVRGWWLRDRLLCDFVAPEPGELREALPAPASAGLSVRKQYEQTVASTNCRACHALFDPLGFGLDRFDAVGRVRSEDRNGQPYDTAATLKLSGESDLTFTDPATLGAAIAGSVRMRACFVRRWVELATGGAVVPDVEDAQVWTLANTPPSARATVRDLIAAAIRLAVDAGALP